MCLSQAGTRTWIAKSEAETVGKTSSLDVVRRAACEPGKSNGAQATAARGLISGVDMFVLAWECSSCGAAEENHWSDQIAWNDTADPVHASGRVNMGWNIGGVLHYVSVPPAIRER